jgi:hypothetical protein
MPLTAWGEYQLALSHGEDQESVIIQTFKYYPVGRILAGPVIILLAFLAYRIARITREVRARRGLHLSAIAGAVLLGVSLLTDSDLGPLFSIGAGELLALPVVFLILCSFRKRSIIGAVTITYVVNVLLAYLCASLWIAVQIAMEAVVEMSTFILLAMLVLAANWVLPACLGLLAVRHRFSWKRLAIGTMLVMISVSAIILYASCMIGMSDSWQDAIPLALLPLPYLVVHCLILSTNVTWRTAVFRAFGLKGPEESVISGP